MSIDRRLKEMKGLKMNIEKTKILTVGREQNEELRVEIGEDAIYNIWE